jgi:hypothetical protein
MISIDNQQIFVPSIPIIDFPAVMSRNEVIAFRSNEKGWYKTLVSVFYRRQGAYIKVCCFQDG